MKLAKKITTAAALVAAMLAGTASRRLSLHRRPSGAVHRPG